MPRRGQTEASATRALEAAAGLPEGAEVQVVLFSGKDAAAFDARRLNPTHSLAEAFRERAARFADTTTQRRPVPYSAGRVPAEYEVAYLDLAQVPVLANALALVEDPVELELFDPASTEARALRFYIVGVRKDNPGWTHFIKSKGQTLRLRRTGKIAAVMRGAAYDELAEDPLVFDDHFDAIAANQLVLIVNQSTFQRSMGFLDEARALAAQTLDEITKRLDVANLTDFVSAATSDVNMIAKLRSIAEKIAADPRYAAAMTTDRVIDFARNNEIDIDFEEVDGKRSLVFHSEPARRWRILKLIDDDYLHSQLTELDYEVNSKSPL